MVSSQTVAALYIDPRGPYPRMAAAIARDVAAHGHLPRAYGMPNAIDCWDAARDARLYAGPHPVVAHPPCKHWGRLRHLALNEWVCNNPECPHPREAVTRENMADYAVGDWEPCIHCEGACYVTSDRDCAPRAVEQVRAYGGVLEHPAGSKLWESELLPPPYETPSEGLPEDSPLWRKHNAWPLWKGGRATDGFGYTIELDQCEWGHVARKRTWLYLVGVPREALEAPPFPGREPTHRIGSSTCGREDGTRYRPASGLRSASAQQRRRTPPLFAEYLVRLARSVQK